ncbi:MAG: hypothetical protein JO051_14195 [Acidobacteriaceae bacterium]|nr:hypothetical protein [Acidobacteriaceae bacterium]
MLLTRSAKVLSGALVAVTLVWAQTPDMSGTWEMDAAKSKVTDGRAVTLVIESAGKKIKLLETSKNNAGKETTAEFTCAPDGKECEFVEGGHKSKMSMWFMGDSLNVAKTDGPPGDVVDEWKLQMSPGGKALTLTVTHIEPAGADETLAFSKKAP